MNRLAVILILLLSCALIFFIVRSKNRLKKIEGLESVIQEKDSEIERAVNRLGQERVSRMVAEADREIIKKAYREEIDSVKLKLGVKIKNLELIVKAQTTNTGQITTKVDTLYDTLYREMPLRYYNFNYRDRWITLGGTLRDGMAEISWTVRDRLTFALERQPKGLMRPKELVIHATSDNPNTRYENLMSVKVGVERRKPFSIGPYIGVGPRGNVQIGIGIQYSIIRF